MAADDGRRSEVLLRIVKRASEENTDVATLLEGMLSLYDAAKRAETVAV